MPAIIQYNMVATLDEVHDSSQNFGQEQNKNIVFITTKATSTINKYAWNQVFPITMTNGYTSILRWKPYQNDLQGVHMYKIYIGYITGASKLNKGATVVYYINVWLCRVLTVLNVTLIYGGQWKHKYYRPLPA